MSAFTALTSKMTEARYLPTGSQIQALELCEAAQPFQTSASYLIAAFQAQVLEAGQACSQTAWKALWLLLRRYHVLNLTKDMEIHWTATTMRRGRTYGTHESYLRVTPGLHR